MNSHLFQPDINHLKQLIIDAAQTELMPRFKQVSRQFKADGSIVTSADIHMQAHLQQALHRYAPDIAFLAEEMSVKEQQAAIDSDHPLWCLDPLDGTSNFAAGIPVFSVSLSLIQHGQVILGIVYDPIKKECFSAAIGQGAYLNEIRLNRQDTQLTLKQSIALIDFKRLPPQLSQRLVTEPPYASQRSFGSGALDWCWIAAGRCHVYLHGQQNLWDYGAGHLILSEAGGHSCTLESDSQYHPRLPPRSVIAALNENLFKHWKDYILA